MMTNPTPWIARHGLTSDQYQNEFDTHTDNGYRLTHVAGYAINDQPRFAAIWEKIVGPAWTARHGLTATEYQQTFDQLVGEGYRLTLVNAYTVNRTIHYAAIWEQRSGPAWKARHGMTSNEYQMEFMRNARLGFRLTRVDGCGFGDAARYAAIWEKRPGPPMVARHGLTSVAYQDTFEALVNQGYRLSHVSAYTMDGKDLYAAIWEKESGPVWIARHRMSSNSYQGEFTDYAIQGYRLKSICGYELLNGARYAAIWEAGPTALTGVFCANGQCFDLKRLADNIEQALQGDNVAKYGFEVRRGLSVIQRASGPARTHADPPAREFTVFDRFNPASVSKTVTAIAVQQLLAKRRLSIHAKIHPFLPTPWKIPASVKTITFAELLSHKSGFRSKGVSLFYDGIQQMVEAGVNMEDKVKEYENVNYALLRILVASLDGFNDWTNDPGPKSASRFISYVNKAIFAPLGIFNVAYEPTATHPPLFYAAPPGNGKGTSYGDWSERAGSAGSHISIHELAIFVAAVFNGTLLSASQVQTLKDQGLGFGDYGEMPDGGHAWGKGGFFPGSDSDGKPTNSGAQLSTMLVHFDSGVEAMLMINGLKDAKSLLLDAYRNAFVPESTVGKIVVEPLDGQLTKFPTQPNLR